MWKPYVGKTGVLDGYYNAEEWCYVVLDVSTLSTAWCHVPSPELSDWLLGWQGDGDPAGRRKPFKTDVIAPDPDAATAPSRPIPEGVPPPLVVPVKRTSRALRMRTKLKANPPQQVQRLWVLRQERRVAWS